MASIQLEQLRSSVRGAIIQPADDAYEAARRVYNEMIDKRPAVIVRAVDVAHKLGAGARVGAEHAAHGRGDHLGIGLLHTTHHRAHMHALGHHRHTLRPSSRTGTWNRTTRLLPTSTMCSAWCRSVT